MRLAARKRGSQLVAVHIGYKVKALGFVCEFIQRQHRHLRPQVRATNANIHHVGDGAVRADAAGIGQHGVARSMHSLEFVLKAIGVIFCYVFNSYM